MSNNSSYSHVEVCCFEHGCLFEHLNNIEKYGICDVVSGEKTQKYACRWCVPVKDLKKAIKNLKHQLEWSQNLQELGIKRKNSEN